MSKELPRTSVSPVAPEKEPVLAVGYITGVLDDGTFYFDLVGGEQMGAVNLAGIHALASDEVSQRIEQHKINMRGGLQLITAGLKTLLVNSAALLKDKETTEGVNNETDGKTGNATNQPADDKKKNKPVRARQ